MEHFVAISIVPALVLGLSFPVYACNQEYLACMRACDQETKKSAARSCANSCLKDYAKCSIKKGANAECVKQLVAREAHNTEQLFTNVDWNDPEWRPNYTYMFTKHPVKVVGAMANCF